MKTPFANMYDTVSYISALCLFESRIYDENKGEMLLSTSPSSNYEKAFNQFFLHPLLLP